MGPSVPPLPGASELITPPVLDVSSSEFTALIDSRIVRSGSFGFDQIDSDLGVPKYSSSGVSAYSP